MCGEYGSDEKTTRPHYHALLFGYAYPDTRVRAVRDGNTVYSSELLTQQWGRGRTEIGNVSFKSAAYCARYIVKKQSLKPGENSYAIVDHETGEIVGERIPEYTNMSTGRKKERGIGYSWYKKYKMDLFPHDYAVTPDGRQMSVPTYYRELLKKEDPDLHKLLLEARVERAKSSPDNTPARLSVRETCQELKNLRLKRQLK